VIGAGLRAVRGAIRAAHLAADAALDRRRGVDTTAEVELADLHLADAHLVDYQASGWRDLRAVLPPGSVGPDDVFLDVGSGKGRILLEAATRYPFRRVIGLELSAALNEIAARNLAACESARRSGPVELVTADVRAYRVPDDVTVVYAYNPFGGPVFQQLVDELVASVDRRPRSVRLVYRNPVEHDRLAATGRFRLVRVRRGRRPGRRWSELTSIRVYELR
jgi:SAM-dependent methyltransferase